MTAGSTMRGYVSTEELRPNCHAGLRIILLKGAHAKDSGGYSVIVRDNFGDITGS